MQWTFFMPFYTIRGSVSRASGTEEGFDRVETIQDDLIDGLEV